MFTTIDNEIYQVNGDKMRKIVIENGVIKTDGKVENYDGVSILVTANELRRQYAELFKPKENNFNITDEELLKELDEKDNKIRHLEKELENKNVEIENLNKELNEALQVLEQQDSNNKGENSSNKENLGNPKDKEQK